MIAIFNKNNNSSAELKEFIPYIDKDFKFDNLIPDINTSIKELKKLIGSEILDLLVQVYAEADYTDLQKEFLRVVRYPIIVNAYRFYAPTNDLSHTNNGRKMTSDTSMKMPFEHMIDRDNDAQEKRYYRALDDLIDYLDAQQKFETPADEDEEFENSIYQAWTNSDNFKKSHQLFVRTYDDFNDNFPIKSRLILLMLRKGLELCETDEIIPRISKNKYDELKTKLQAAEEISDNEKKLIKYIQQGCVMYAMAWSIPRFSVNLYPEGVLQHYTSDRITSQAKKPSLNLEPQTAQAAFKLDFEKSMRQLEQFIAPAAITDASIPVENPSDIIYNINNQDKFFTT